MHLTEWGNIDWRLSRTLLDALPVTFWEYALEVSIILFTCDLTVHLQFNKLAKLGVPVPVPVPAMQYGHLV